MKKYLMIILGLWVLCVGYVFAVEIYDSKPDKLQRISEKISIEDITYEELGISLKGIEYDTNYTVGSLLTRNEEMTNYLGHEVSCSKLCTLSHEHFSQSTFERLTDFPNQDENSYRYTNSESGEHWAYTFTAKQQKDINHNTYYNLDITGNEDLEKLDTLWYRGKRQLEIWDLEVEESCYFKGYIEGTLSQEREEEITKQLLGKLRAKTTNYYEDEANSSTRVYYGYTPYFDGYIKENNGDKTNMQIGLKYNEALNQTEIIVAFPFYNMPF